MCRQEIGTQSSWRQLPSRGNVSGPPYCQLICTTFAHRGWSELKRDIKGNFPYHCRHVDVVEYEKTGERSLCHIGEKLSKSFQKASQALVWSQMGYSRIFNKRTGTL